MVIGFRPNPFPEEQGDNILIQEEKIKENDMILAKNEYYDMDCFKTKLNNNIIIVGTSGAGKTRSIIIPNILQAIGSYLISDPKGVLYNRYHTHLEKHGYETKILSFVNFSSTFTSNTYNPFSYIHNEQDILKISHILVGQIECSSDHFWEYSSEVLLSSLISYMMEAVKEENRTLSTLLTLVGYCKKDDTCSRMDVLMQKLKQKNVNSFAVKQYEKINTAPSKTYDCIVATINAKLGMLDSEQVRNILKNNSFSFSELGQRKMAIFVVVSDMDRSLDKLANLFFTQALQELCLYADTQCEDFSLPVPVRFILDDFATNVAIDDFPRTISSIRSRNISCILAIQSESQLTNYYGENGNTVITNCDTYIYMGGNDVTTAAEVARRTDMSIKEIMALEVGHNILFRRGSLPKFCKNYDLSHYPKDIN